MATLKYKDPVTGEVKRVGIGGGSGGSADTSDSVLEQNKREEQKFWVGTKAEFDAVETKDNNTMYVVTDEPAEDNPGVDYLPLSGGTMTGQIKMGDVSDPAQGTRFYANQGFGISVQADINDDSSPRYAMKLNLPSVDLDKALGLMKTDEEGNTNAYYIYGEHNKPTAGDVVGIVNPNLLDNWYFANPVNQRGQTSYSGGVYTIDRWVMNPSCAVELVDDSVCIKSLTFTGNAYPSFTQLIEFPEQFIGKRLTFSVLAKNPNGTYMNMAVKTQTGGSGFAVVGSKTISADWMLYTCSGVVPEGTTKIFVNMTLMLPTAETDYFYIKAAKLELGDQQTLAHQDENGNWVLNEIPNYGEELLRCIQSKADSSDTYANKVIATDDQIHRPYWYYGIPAGGSMTLNLPENNTFVFSVSNNVARMYSIVSTANSGKIKAVDDLITPVKMTATYTADSAGITIANTATYSATLVVTSLHPGHIYTGG